MSFELFWVLVGSHANWLLSFFFFFFSACSSEPLPWTARESRTSWSIRCCVDQRSIPAETLSSRCSTGRSPRSWTPLQVHSCLRCHFCRGFFFFRKFWMPKVLVNPLVNTVVVIMVLLSVPTASDYTMYPFSTQNGKDFQNLLSVYLDAVFFPCLREQDFR